MGPMDGREKPPRRLEISITQLLAGSAAAVCGAWLASKIGVAGTVIGAGLVSALVTILSAVYAQGARRAREQLLARREAVRTRGQLPATYAADSPAADDAVAARDDRAGVDRAGVDRAGVDRAGVDQALTSTNPLFLPPFELEDARGYRWGRIALAALAVFVVGMVAVTGVELVVGHSFACSTAGIGCQGSTTLPIPGRTHGTSKPKPASPSTRPTGSTSPSPSASTSTGSTSPSPTGSPTVTATPSSTVSPTPSSTVSPSPTVSQTPAG
jgi:hypothetical protein